MKVSFLIFSTVLSFPAAALAAVCVENNTMKCDALGYTESSCKYGGIACPFDTSRWSCTQWTCEDGRYKSKAGINDNCLEVEYKDMTCFDCVPAICEIGSVYYADGTCGFAQNYDGSKLPVGVVYYVTDETGEHGKVINLKNLAISTSDYTFNPANPYSGGTQSIGWGLYGTDVSGLTNYSTSSMLTGLKNEDEQIFSGKENTALIAATSPKYTSCTNGTYKQGTSNYAKYCYPTAASAALAFYPPGVAADDPVVGAGQWYLPAIGELMLLYGTDFNAVTSANGKSGSTGDTRSIVNTTLTALSNAGISITKVDSSIQNVWSSTEYSSNYPWFINFSGGTRYYSYGKYQGYRVRTSLEF